MEAKLSARQGRQLCRIRRKAGYRISYKFGNNKAYDYSNNNNNNNKGSNIYNNMNNNTIYSTPQSYNNTEC